MSVRKVWRVTAGHENCVPLRDYFAEVVRRLDERHASLIVSVQHAQEQSNEWRGALNDRDRYGVTRVEFDAARSADQASAAAANAANSAAIHALAALLTAGFESLRLINAGRGGGRAALVDLRVWLVAVMTIIVAAIVVATAIVK